MTRFKYVKAASINGALDFMSDHPGSFIIAGGTDLMVKIRETVVKPTMVIDVTGIAELNGIRLVEDRLTIGAVVTHTELSESELVGLYAPALAEASSLVGSPQIRNRGTVGGNIVNASPAADTVPALFIYNAAVTVTGPQGSRQVHIGDFFTGPGRTVLAAGEMIVEISLPLQKAGQASSFQKLGKRKAQAISVVNAAAYLAMDRATGKVTDVRLALGSVAATVVRVREAEQGLWGRTITPSLICEAGNKAAATISPIDDIRSTAIYRREAGGVLIARALECAWRRINKEDRP